MTTTIGSKPTVTESDRIMDILSNIETMVSSITSKTYNIISPNCPGIDRGNFPKSLLSLLRSINVWLTFRKIWVGSTKA